MTDNIITLIGPNDEEVEFEEIAGISLGTSFYLILQPIKKIFNDEEAYVFEVIEEEGKDPEFFAVTDEEVLKEVGLEYNAHLMRGVSGNLLDILSLNYGKTEERIRQENPYIADITIAVKIPSEVKITVKERRKIAYVSTPDGYIALDRYGTVLEINSGKVKQDVRPIVYGISIESAKLGEKVKVKDENAYKRAIVVLGSILSADNATIGDKFNMFEHTTDVRILPSGYIFLTIYTESGKPVQVKLSMTDKINEKMTWLLYAFNSNAFDQVTVFGTLDMTGDEPIFNPSAR